MVLLSIFTNPDVYQFLDNILRHVQRIPNLRFFYFYESSQSLSQIPSSKFEDLGPVCKNLKEVVLDFSLNNFDLWHTFRHFDELQRLEIKGFSSVLKDSILPIKRLVCLTKFKIQCVSIGYYFFNDVTEFCPNVKVLSICVRFPRHRLENHCLTALSECKKLKILEIEMPTNIIVFEIEEQIRHDIDDIGIFRLLDKCRDIE